MGVGRAVGIFDGIGVGAAVGDVEGSMDSARVGSDVGFGVGFAEGNIDGSEDGSVDGMAVGDVDGASVSRANASTTVPSVGETTSAEYSSISGSMKLDRESHPSSKSKPKDDELKRGEDGLKNVSCR